MKIRERGSFFLLTLSILIVMIVIVFGFIFGIAGLFGVSADPLSLGMLALVIVFILCIFLIAQEEIETMVVSIAGFIILLIIFESLIHNLSVSLVLSIISALIILVYTMSKFSGA